LISRLTAFLMGNKLAQAVGGVPTAICKAQLICGLTVVGGFAQKVDPTHRIPRAQGFEPALSLRSRRKPQDNHV
jgi:hypothetical protein